MFFAIMASIITLVIPLVVRYITSTVIYYETDEAFRVILKLGLMMTVLILFQCYCNYFIANYGHVMGAKIELRIIRSCRFPFMTIRRWDNCCHALPRICSILRSFCIMGRKMWSFLQ